LGEGGEKIPGVKGASSERGRINVKKAQIPGHEAVFRKSLGGDELLDGIMLGGRAKILADGQNVAADLAKIPHDRQELMATLSEAHHDARLGHHSHIHPLGPFKNPE